MASAQTTPFQASVGSTLVRGGGTLPSGGCSNGAFSCGTANLAGYGAASWDVYPNFTPVLTSCGTTYTAMTYFTLASDGSTLVLNESGHLCSPGLNANGYFMEGPKAYGHPFSALGSWTPVTTDCSAPSPVAGEPTCSTGQFENLGGGGTDTLSFDGAHAAGNYSGTLG